MKQKKGFTLIELLVVIAIIALLLAILMPSLRKAKDLAKLVACKTNCKTFGLANAMYANEYNNCLVKNHDRTLPKINGREPLWCTNQTFLDYIAISNEDTAWSVPQGSFELPERYQCPGAKMRKRDDPSWGPWIIRTTYGFNGYSGGNFFWSNKPYTWRLTNIRGSADQKIIFIDGSDILATVPGANYKTKWDLYGDRYRHPDNFSGSVAMTSYRHNEKANITFADGHAGTLKKEEVFFFDTSGNPDNVRNDQLWLVHEL